MHRNNDVCIVEVGPRDGLQNIQEYVATEHKVALIRKLASAGCSRIEVTSFVRGDLVPQLKDAEAICAALPEEGGVQYSALVANGRGLLRAFEAGVREVAVIAAASETFSRKNIGKSIDDSFIVYRDIVSRALQNNMLVRGYVSTAFWCPYEGKIHPDAVADVTAVLLDMGVYEVSLADTIGKAKPHEVNALLNVLLTRHDPCVLALHMHDTNGCALENIMSGYELGIRTFDSSIGGLGGCPFAGVSVGNVATEDVVQFFEERDVTTGIDRTALMRATEYIQSVLE